MDNNLCRAEKLNLYKFSIVIFRCADKMVFDVGLKTLYVELDFKKVTHVIKLKATVSKLQVSETLSNIFKIALINLDTIFASASQPIRL